MLKGLCLFSWEHDFKPIPLQHELKRIGFVMAKTLADQEKGRLQNEKL
jgi:hypothetical protein